MTSMRQPRATPYPRGTSLDGKDLKGYVLARTTIDSISFQGAQFGLTTVRCGMLWCVLFVLAILLSFLAALPGAAIALFATPTTLLAFGWTPAAIAVTTTAAFALALYRWGPNATATIWGAVGVVGVGAALAIVALPRGPEAVGAFVVRCATSVMIAISAGTGVMELVSAGTQASLLLAAAPMTDPVRSGPKYALPTLGLALCIMVGGISWLAVGAIAEAISHGGISAGQAIAPHLFALATSCGFVVLGLMHASASTKDSKRHSSWTRRFATQFCCSLGTTFEQSLIASSNFRDCRLMFCNFRNADLNVVDFRGAKGLALADFAGTPLEDDRVKHLVSALDWPGGRMAAMDLSGMMLKGANLVGVTIDDVCLDRAVLDESNLQGTVWRLVSVAGTSFRGSRMDDCSILSWRVDQHTQFDDVTGERASLGHATPLHGSEEFRALLTASTVLARILDASKSIREVVESLDALPNEMRDKGVLASLVVGRNALRWSTTMNVDVKDVLDVLKWFVGTGVAIYREVGGSPKGAPPAPPNSASIDLSSLNSKSEESIQAQIANLVTRERARDLTSRMKEVEEMRKRLRVLRQQIARTGEVSAPPEKIVERDDLEEKIRELLEQMAEELSKISGATVRFE